MTDPVLGPSESLGNDSPTVGEKAVSWAGRHIGLTSLLALALCLVVAASVTAWWRARPPEPGPFDSIPMEVKSTGMGGVVREQIPMNESESIAMAVVVLEVKASVSASPDLLGTVMGLTGPGVTATNAQGIPPIIGGGSSVGLVYATVSCARAFDDELSYRLVVSLTDGMLTQTREVALGEVQPEWMALLRRACQ